MANDLAARLRARLDPTRPALAMAAHNAISAKLAAEAGFDAIWGSGFELSAAHAVPDASILSWDTHLAAMRAMVEVQAAPVIADIDTGQGNAVNVAYLVPRYAAAGVAAVVMEDKTFPKDSSLRPGGRQELVPIAEFQGKIEAARIAAGPLVIARIDADSTRLKGTLESQLASVHAGEVAVFLQPFDRGLRTDAPQAGNVVGGVADEREVVGDQPRGHAELLLDGGGVQPAPTERGVRGRRRGQLQDGTAHALAEILVGTDDDAGMALGRETAHRRGDQVVGLDAAALKDLEAQQGREGLDLRQLEHDVLGRVVALGLVLGQGGEVAIGATEVEEHGAAVRLLGSPEVEQGLHPAVQGAGGELVGGSPQVGALHREVATEDQVEAIDEQPAHAGSFRTPPRASSQKAASNPTKEAGPPSGGPESAEEGRRLTCRRRSWPGSS